MRTLAKNKQMLYYSLLLGNVPVYVLDENGNKIIDYVDGEGNIYYRETGEYKKLYSEPVSFYGNISMSGGESEAVEFGLNLSDYSAVLITSKDYIPLSETSRIWHETKPEYNLDGTINEFSADYIVVKVSPSLNEDKFILQKIVK